jgi:DNA-binding NarL/FixJ family response regulator
MTTNSIRVLIVDDFAPWRRFVFSTVQRRSQFTIVCEVSDGVDAVQKAQELQPDIILLDIGLPKLNGIAVARRIREFSPKPRILFVSQESSADVVQEAFNVGGCGYVAKTDVERELLTVMDASLRGERFVSSSLTGDGFSRVSESRPSGT